MQLLYLIGILFLVFGLIVSVALHELGHMIPARIFGAAVPKYMIGFGPTLYSRKIGGTEYGLKAILLGGYVQIAGMFYPGRESQVLGTYEGAPLTVAQYRTLSAAQRESVDLTDAGALRARTLDEEAAGQYPFYRLRPWQRIVVMLGGPVMNALLAFVLFAVSLLGIGLLQPSLTLDGVVTCPNQATSCPRSQQTPAALADLRAGDRVIAANGAKLDSWEQLTKTIANSAGRPLQLEIEREGEISQTHVTPVKDDKGNTRIGIISRLERHAVTPSVIGKVWWQTTKATAELLIRLPMSVWNAGAAIFGQQERDSAGVISIVGASRAAGEVAAGTTSAGNSQGFADRVVTLLMLLGSLNIALFVFNLIPLTPLDGGHIIAVIYEAVRNAITRKRIPVDTARAIGITYVVFGLLALMTVILILADFVAPVHI